jgi:hypothetical protein
MIARLGLLAGVALFGLGCVPVRYLPRDPPAGSPGHPPVSLDGITIEKPDVAPPKIEVTREGMAEYGESGAYFERNTTIAVRVQTREALEVAGMWFGDPGSRFCAGEHLAIALAVDGRTRWERPLIVSGDHVITGTFAAEPARLQVASVVDVRLVEPDSDRKQTCVRVPVTRADVPQRADKRWSAGGRLSYRRALPFDASSTFALGISLGRWLGPLRLGVEGFLGGTNESSSTAVQLPGTSLCFLAPGKDCTDVTMGGWALESSGILWRRARLALGWSLAYERLIARLRPNGSKTDPYVDRTANGVRLAVQVLRSAPGVLGASPRDPTSAGGLELFLASPLGPRTGSGASLTWGIAVVGF